MNRQAMIDRLVEDDIQTIKNAMQNREIEYLDFYLDFILRSGIGYNKMSDESLIEEFENRTWEAEE